MFGDLLVAAVAALVFMRLPPIVQATILLVTGSVAMVVLVMLLRAVAEVSPALAATMGAIAVAIVVLPLLVLRR